MLSEAFLQRLDALQLAMRAPARSSSARMRETSVCEPWHWISATSSRV